MTPLYYTIRKKRDFNLSLKIITLTITLIQNTAKLYFDTYITTGGCPHRCIHLPHI